MGMDEDKTFYTATMARVYAGQGRYDAAARIYRFLLEQAPDRTDLQRELNGVLSMMPAGRPQGQALSDLVQAWVRWMVRYQTLHRLQRIGIPSLGEAARPGGGQERQPRKPV